MVVIILMSEVLPAPFGPSNPKMDWRGIASETLLTAI
jgi:hypothetical protein